MTFKQVLICLLLCFNSLFFACSRQDDPAISENGELFPSIAYKDTFGHKIGQAVLGGHYIYVQFIKSWSKALQNEIEGLSADPQSFNGVVILFIASDTISTPRNPSRRNNVFIIQDEKYKLADIFGAPRCCDSYFIYNQLARLMHKGTNHHAYVNEVRPFLLEIAREGDILYFDSRYKTKKLMEAELPEALLRELVSDTSRKRFHFIALLGNICTGCSAGTVIRHVNEVYASKPRSLGFFLLVSDNYTNIDIDNMAKFLNIAVPIGRAPIEIINVWNTLQNSLPVFFDNIFLIIDSQGTLISVFDDRDPSSFYMKLENLCAET